MSSPSSTSGFLEPPDAADVATALRRMMHDQLAGVRVGSFTLESVLDTGGMGAVFAAVQDAPRRKVAVKILRADVLSPRSVRRFRLEEELLGVLRHPGIAEIYDAGTLGTDCGPWSGLPWFAMEFIDGAASLLEHAERRNLSDQERVRLLADTCAAVGHAHAAGVVHRDLKPANVLVGADGHPKVIDFGVARAAEVDLSDSAPGTASGEVVGTMRYMSPEQAGAGRGTIGPWTDVYALGVLGFELLTGHHPCEPRGENLPQLARSLETAEPVPLRRVAPHLDRDLERVLAKAIERAPGARYRDADELADDLRRALEHRPVRARRAGSAARTLRRLRGPGLAAAAAVAVFALLALGAWRLAGRSAADARSARRDDLLMQATALGAEIVRETSERRLPDTRHVASVLEGLVADHEAARALDRGGAAGGGGPDLAAGVRLAEGTLAGLRGDAALALALARDAPQEGELADEFLWLEATSLAQLGRHAESLAVFDRLAEHKPDVASSWFNRGTTLARMGRNEDAVASYRRGLELAPDDPRALDELGVCLTRLGRLEEALEALERSVALDPRSYNAHQSLASALSRSGRPEDAVETMEFGLRLEPRNPFGHYNLGVFLQNLGRPGEAAESFGRACELRPDVPSFVRERGRALLSDGRLAEAAAELERAVELAPGDPVALRHLGRALQALGRDAEAAAAYGRALRVAPGDARVREQLAFLCVAGGDWEGAREHFAWLAAARPGDASAGYNLACALSRLGRLDEALEALAGAAGDPDLRELARGDPDLAALRADPERAARVAEVLAGP